MLIWRVEYQAYVKMLKCVISLIPILVAPPIAPWHTKCRQGLHSLSSWSKSQYLEDNGSWHHLTPLGPFGVPYFQTDSVWSSYPSEIFTKLSQIIEICNANWCHICHDVFLGCSNDFWEPGSLKPVLGSGYPFRTTAGRSSAARRVCEAFRWAINCLGGHGALGTQHKWGIYSRDTLW